MTDPDSGSRPRRRWGNLGEFIALAALLVSGLGLWLNWQAANGGPTEIVEKRQAVPLVLRGKIGDDGKDLALAPVETTHALQQLILRLPGGNSVNLDGDGDLSAREFASVIGRAADKKGDGSIIVVADVRYVEAGADRSSSRRYRIRYRVDGGGLFGGRSLRLTGFGPA